MTKRREPEFVATVVASVVIEQRVPDRRFKSGYRSSKPVATQMVTSQGAHDLSVGALSAAPDGIWNVFAHAPVSIGQVEVRQVKISS